MKICLFLLFAFAFQLMATNTNAQDAIIELRSNSVTVSQLISEIEKQTDYLVVYSNREVNTSRTVSLKNKSDKVSEYLNQTFSGTDIGYDFEKNYIVLSKKAQQTASILTNLTQTVQQQGKTVRGTVTDSNGEPVIGATIIVKDNPSQGTVTDIDGNFILSNLSENAVLQITYVGMKAQEVNTSGRSTINVIMEADIELLDEVVVVGYGTMKKSDLTGSIASVQGDLISSFSNTTVSQALQGRVAGVHVQQNSGHPGGNIQVRIRGTNSIRGSNEPLWIIDGFPGDQNMINISDIESIDVLKDASATAIYGSRGANGVVIVTTKQGRKGQMQVDYSGSFSIQTVRKKLDLLNAEEYMRYMNIQQINKTGTAFFTDEEINNVGKGTDWQDLNFHEAPIHDHSINISGGNERTQYSLGGSFLDQKGIIKNNGYQRMTLRSNLDHNINDKINISSNILLSRADHDKQTSEGGNRGTTLIGAIIVAPPTLSPYTEDGNYNQLNTVYSWLSGLQNPIAWVNERSYKWYSNRTLANIALTYKPINGLSIKISGNVFNANNRQDNYETTKYPLSSGKGSISIGETLSLNNDNIITYETIVNEKHNFSIMGGITYEQTISKSIGASGDGFLSDIPETYNIGSAITPGIASSGYSKWALLSYLSRLNYSYDNKYLATFSFRSDGSSRYSVGSKWGHFPSGALAWRVSEENFMNYLPFLSNLKLRVGYGITGSTAISPYSTLDLMSTGQTAFDKELYTYFSPSSYYLSDLKWETTAQTNFGMDAAFFDNRLRLTADYYIKNTSDLLNVVEMPRSSGFISSTMNIGEIQNRGLELQLDADVIDRTFKWNVSSNIAFNRNKVIKLSKGEDMFLSTLDIVIIRDQLNLLREGEPIGVFYGYQEDGYDENGNIIYKDNVEDGTINSLDKTIIGNPNPDFIYSFNSIMNYKNFVFSFYIQGTHGNDLYSLSMAALTTDYQEGINTLKEVFYDHWSVETPNAKYPALTPAATSSLKMSDRFVYDGSYLRLKNIEFAYNIPTTSISWVKRAQVFVSGQNLFTITRYPFWDPDVNAKGGSSSITQGVDEYVYPVSKSFTGGIRLSF